MRVASPFLLDPVYSFVRSTSEAMSAQPDYPFRVLCPTIDETSRFEPTTTPVQQDSLTLIPRSATRWLLVSSPTAAWSQEDRHVGIRNLGLGANTCAP